MFIVLLSGGSGRRLWPLSNELRSKQYIKLISNETTNSKCSMVQRVWSQIENSGFSDRAIITASSGQVEIIKSQLGNVNIAIEPERRDTFPAVALSCAYLKDKMGAINNDYVCILPVDPYTDKTYFETIKTLETALELSNAEIALMGVTPNYATDKYGYIITDNSRYKEYKKVISFHEKPNMESAKELIKQGAYWNCGVFCFKIGFLMDIVNKQKMPISYEGMFNNYSYFHKISFDYAILEKSKNMILIEFNGLWEDLGSWESLTKKMNTDRVGKVISDDIEQTHIVNELDVPVIAIGVKNLIIVAAFDGILIADKNESTRLKDVLQDKVLPSMYEERRWGTLKTMDLAETSEGFTLVRKIRIFTGMSSSYHYHNDRDETLTILSGRGEMIIEGVTLYLSQGTTITIPRGKKHAIKSAKDLEYMEIHMGKTIGDDDINRITFDWNSILKAHC